MRSGYNFTSMTLADATAGGVAISKVSPSPSAGTELMYQLPAGAEAIQVTPASQALEFRLVAGGGTLGTHPIAAGIPFEICGKPGDKFYFGRAVATAVNFLVAGTK